MGFWYLNRFFSVISFMDRSGKNRLWSSTSFLSSYVGQSDYYWSSLLTRLYVSVFLWLWWLLFLCWGQCLLLLVHVDEHALAILHTQMPRITKSYEKNLPCSQTKLTKLTPKTTVIDIGSKGTGKNEKNGSGTISPAEKNYIINKGSMYFVLDKLIPNKIKNKKQKFKVPKPNPKIRASESNISAGLMTSFKTPPPRPKPNRTITKVDFFQEDFFLKYEGSRIVFP